MKSVVILGTSHSLQGAAKHARIDDPNYAKLVEDLISSREIDLIFEEASGCGPTHAEGIAGARKVPYVDLDPHPDERAKYGFASETGRLIKDSRLGLCYELIFIEPHAGREAIWLQRICERHFKSGLIICGSLHVLSLGLRLRSTGFDVKSAYLYCGKQELKSESI